MAQPLSIENSDWTFLITTRTAGSKLWFNSNKNLENMLLGALAKYQERYEVKIYAFIVMGNHYHLIARFPKMNRALFMRDFNSAAARLVGRYISEHGRRSVWERRYSFQVLPNPEDVYNWFLYVATNPVSSGVVRRISEYPGYNSVDDCANQRTRKYNWIDWSSYLLRRRSDPTITPNQFVKVYTLTYSRLPNLEHLSNEEYRTQIRKSVMQHQEDSAIKRKALGLGFMGSMKMNLIKPGTKPYSTKQTKRYGIRPIVLTLCSETRKLFLNLYFSIKQIYSEVSVLFRAGNFSVNFPPGTYRPPVLIVS